MANPAQGADLGLSAGLELSLCPGAITGGQLLRMPEAVFLARCMTASVAAPDISSCSEDSRKAKDLYGCLWKLAVDAKTRTRRKDGSIVSAADLEAEAAETERAMRAKADQWKSRNAAMDAARKAGEDAWTPGTAPEGPIQHMVEQRWKGPARR